MRFEVDHPLPGTPERVSAALFDPAFQASLSGVGGLRERTVLSVDGDGHGTIRRVRCVLDLQVSGMAKTVLGDSDPAWVQEEHWDPERISCDWTIEPDVAADLLSASGTIGIEATATGSIRRVTGDVKVRVPLYGGKVEGWIVEGVTRAYDEEAKRIEAWLGREK